MRLNYGSPRRVGLPEHGGIERLALAARHAQVLPLRAAQVLGQLHELAHMVGIVRHLPLHGRQHGVRLAPNGHLAQ